jgi:glucose dehydrogenase
MIPSACALLVCFAAGGSAQSAKAPAGDWPSYDHDPASTRYSLLTQINTKNVAELKSA